MTSGKNVLELAKSFTAGKSAGYTRLKGWRSGVQTIVELGSRAQIEWAGGRTSWPKDRGGKLARPER
ncbi:hypothetical protein TIFTF001_016956 [Ficus carica]|uniref:Uncharacterized protein n=1 Tax=Ficus carica TaxID=3494 RepID=A0AA88AKE2_FICCA|nr:hypothetical protein TIFTF001_016956 [Ficus carica]